MDDARIQALDFYANQYVVIGNESFRFDGTSLVATKSRKLADFSPLDARQRCLFDLLDNDDIPVKIVKGVAGSGKTKGAMQFALSKVLDGKRFDRYLIVRNPVTVGEEVGYLKGSLADKLAPWQSAICDNLANGRKDFDELVRRGALEWDVPAFMQGRDLKRTFVHVTEAQMLTFDQLRMIGSRISAGSIVVFEGDDDQVLNRKYVENNGLRQIVGKLVGSPLVGYVRLTRSVRSPVAEMFAKLT
jgi:predicted ribonuclease YlaK